MIGKVLISKKDNRQIIVTDIHTIKNKTLVYFKSLDRKEGETIYPPVVCNWQSWVNKNYKPL